MGSTQSSTSSSVDPTLSTRAPPAVDNDRSTIDVSSKKQTSRNNEDDSGFSGMALVNHKCRKKKKIYDRCVRNFYKEFITAPKSLDQEEVCGEKFEAYRTCVLKGIRKEIWDKGNNQGIPPKEGSILSELDED